MRDPSIACAPSSRILLVGFIGIAGMSILGALVLLACLVDVDESLLDRVDAKSADAPVSGDATGGGVVDSGGDAGGVVDAYVGMPCGAGHCLPPTQACCTGSFGDPNRNHGTCDKAVDCKSGDYWECMSATDCAYAQRPPICCATNYPGGGGFSKAICAASCGADASILCDPNAPTCTAPTTCLKSSELTDLYECR